MSGIRLLKITGGLYPLKAAEFRIESLCLEKLLKGLQPYFATLDLEKRIEVSSRWEATRKTLESLPMKKDSLPRMDLGKQRRHQVDARCSMLLS